MTEDSKYGSARDWSQIISGAGQGAQSAMSGASALATSKKEAREAKRRTLANMLNQAIKRNQGLFRAGQEYGGEMNDYQSQNLQDVARSFIGNLQVSRGR